MTTPDTKPAEEKRPFKLSDTKAICPECGRAIKKKGMANHRRDKHGVET